MAWYWKKTQGVFDKGTEVSLQKVEAQQLRERAGRVPSLEESVKTLNAQLGAVTTEHNNYTVRSEQALRIEQQKYNSFSEFILALSRNLVSTLGLTNPSYNTNDPNNLPEFLAELRRDLSSVGHNFPLIRQYLPQVLSRISAERQKERFRDIPRTPIEAYINGVADITDINNPDSVYTSAGLMKQDLERMPNLDALVRLASNEVTRRILGIIGTVVMDGTFQRISHYGNTPNEQQYDAAFNDAFAGLLSKQLRANISQARMSELQEGDYDKLPNIVLKAAGAEVMSPQELQKAVKITLAQYLYRDGSPHSVISLLQHSALKPVLSVGENEYTPNELLKDAVNNVPLYVNAKPRLELDERLYLMAEQLGIPISAENRRSMGQRYLANVLQVNDKGRFDSFKEHPFFGGSIGDNEFLAGVTSYLRNQTPRSSAEAEFSAALAAEHYEQLKSMLTQQGFVELFRALSTTPSAPLGLNALLGLKSQAMYGDAQIREMVDGQIDKGIDLYFTEPNKSLIRDKAHLEEIARNSGNLPESAKRVLLRGVLTSVSDRLSRAIYIGQLLNDIPAQEHAPIFDGVIRDEFGRSLRKPTYEFDCSNALGLLEERIKYAGVDGLDILLGESLTPREVQVVPLVRVRALEQIASTKALGEYLRDETKDSAFIPYINTIIGSIRQSQGEIERKYNTDDAPKNIQRQNAILVELIDRNAHLFPEQTFSLLVNYYLSGSKRKDTAGREDTPLISQGLKRLIELKKSAMRPSEIGAVVGDGIKKLIYDEERGRVIPLSLSVVDDNYINLLLQHRESIPNFGQLVNYSLESVGLADQTPRAVYQVLQRVDRANLGQHVDAGIREKTYSRILTQADDQITRYSKRRGSERMSHSRDSSVAQYLDRELQNLGTFIDDEANRLTPEHLVYALGTLLRANQFDAVNRLLGFPQLQQTDEQTLPSLTEVFKATIEGIAQNDRSYYAEQYMEKLGGRLPQPITSLLQTYIPHPK